MKKIVIVLTMFMSLICVSVNAENVNVNKNILSQLNIINENTFENENAVTREECLTAIIKTLGATDDAINMADGSHVVCFVDAGFYSYIGCAYITHIAYGEEQVVDYPTFRTSHTRKNTDYFLFPKRKVTVKEVLAYMVRCLEESKENIDINITYEKSKEYGLINENDIFTQNPDMEISKNDFYTLLERLLNQKRYKYFEIVNGYFKMSGYVDEERSMTYLEFLSK